MRPHRKLPVIALSAALVATLGLAGVAHAARGHENGPAGGNGHGSGHGHAAVTKIVFHLDQHHVVQWGDVTSAVTLLTHDKNHWTPFVNAEFVLTVDGQDVGTGITDAAGHAAIDYVATDLGGHVLRVIFPGDDFHKRAQRAQGFHVDPAPVED